MKIYLRTLPVSQRTRGWRHVARWLKHIVQGTLVVEVGRTRYHSAS